MFHCTSTYLIWYFCANIASFLGVHHDFPVSTSPRLWAQLAVRAFARATNLLISGQPFRIVIEECDTQCAHVRELSQLLTRFGAQVECASSHEVAHVSLPSDEEPAAESRFQASFVVAPSGLAAQDAALRVGGVRVLAPLQGEPVVVNCDDTLLLDPYDPQIGHGVDARNAYAARRIAWAADRMPITRQAASALAADCDLSGVHVGLSLVLEPKTAVLALELAKAGAQVSVFGHAEETRDDVANILRQRGLQVFADSQATPEQEEILARDFLVSQLHYLLDDGSHLIRMAHDVERAPGALEHMVGCAEETTSGLRPLHTWQAEGRLRVPVMASNDARSKTLFDNAYGTGQSCLLTTLDLLDPSNAGVDMSAQHVTVIGYGDVGRGFARYAHALGARVSVVELDPVRELQARMDGYLTGTLTDLAPTTTMLVSATGERNTINLDALRTLPKGACVTVAGGVDQEVATDDALAAGAHFAPVASPSGGIARQIDDLVFPDGHSVRVTDRGGCINCTAGEGNPIEIMDLSFAVQLASLRELLTQGHAMYPGLHALPREADDAVCTSALKLWMPLTCSEKGD